MSGTPQLLPPLRARHRVQHDRLGIEAVAGPGSNRALETVAVQDVGRQAVDENVPDVAGLVDGRVERDLGDRLLLALLEQHQVEPWAWREKTAKLTPPGSGVAPNGRQWPRVVGKTVLATALVLVAVINCK